MTDHSHDEEQAREPITTLDYSALDGMDQLIVRSAIRPRMAAYAATALAVLVGWFWLVFLSSGASEYSAGRSLGPGMDVFAPVLRQLAQALADVPFAQFILALCSPQTANAGWFALIAASAMWLAMSVAMMLPSAAPMFRTYGDIAHVARTKGETTVPLLVLAAGYLSVWAIFAIAAAALQTLIVVIWRQGDLSAPIVGFAGGLILVGAGAYQFSQLKHACLEKCRNPFTQLFGHWSNEPGAIFRLGMQQGLFCVGCCWALMLVMLVVGMMNLAWMAFFTLFAIIEKSGQGKVTSHVSGVILLVWGGILAISSVAF